MEVAPFFVDFHHFLSIFTICYRFSRLCTFVAIYALFPQFFFGQNSHHHNITRFLHVWFLHPVAWKFCGEANLRLVMKLQTWKQSKDLQMAGYGNLVKLWGAKFLGLPKRGSDLIRILNPLASGRDSPKTILGQNHPKIICWVSPQSNQNILLIHLAKIVLSSFNHTW